MTAICVCALAALAAQRDGPPFPRIANCYGVGLNPYSTEEDIAAVARFDLLIGGVWCNWSDEEQRERMYRAEAAVRELNPHIIILDFSSSAPYVSADETDFPADGWLLQPDGRRILGWPGTEMINLTKPAVLDWLVSRSVRSVGAWGFDGSFIDCMGSGFDWWACNIEHGEPYEVDADGDGQPDDREALNRQWLAAKTQLSRRVREAIGPDAVFMTNQAGEWGIPYMNGILLEDYLDYVLASNLSWNRVLEEYLRWCETPHRPCVTTIVSSSGLEPPYDPWDTMDEAEREALLERGRGLLHRMRFGLATTLMGDGYFAYDLHTRWRGQRWWYPEYDAPLGFPLGPARPRLDGTWRRDFEGGAVVVNPTPFDALVAFEEPRLDVSSQKVGTQFIVPAQDGRLLMLTDEPPRDGTLPDPSPLFTLTGPEPIATRGDRILCRLGRTAALFDQQGRLLALGDGLRSAVEGVRAFIVADDRWRDFAYTDCRYEVLPDGRLRFLGRREDQGAAIRYEQEVTLEPDGLAIAYKWLAETDAHIHMWRLQADLPCAVYGRGTYEAAGAAGQFPEQSATEPVLASGIAVLYATAPDGTRATVSLSGEAALVDERHYGVAAYRLGHHVARGEIRAGQAWESAVRITVQ